MRLFNDLTRTVLEKSLDACSLRQVAISNNVANADTPGYRALTVSFADQLQAALAQPGRFGRQQAVEALKPRIVPRSPAIGRNDRSNVDIEVEMVALAENQLLYQALARQISEKFGQLRLAITGGRR